MKRVAGLATVFVLAGCATAASPTPVASSASANPWDVGSLPDPCRLLTAAEVGTALGSPAAPGTRIDSWPPMCRFPIDSATTTYLYVSDNSLPSGKEDFAARRDGTGPADVVAGLGQLAYWLPEAGALHVLSGPTHLAIVFWGPKTPSGAEDRAVALARLALPRAQG